MGRTRKVEFTHGDVYKDVDFGTYALMMYYAKQLNSTKAEIFFNATISEWNYRVEHDLPEGDLDAIDDLEVHFIPKEIRETIIFIDNELIPALNNETLNLIEKYGGRDNFYKLFYTNPGYLIALGLNDDEFYFDIPSSIVAFLGRLKVVLELALNANTPYEVFIH
ncbi:hypothetical protein SRABI27_03999 [Pedobacter sp. Bi27]|uniref:hypothetical protein n=1 Tax=Pedobacter sp. Bi27 TaxID=2822351 RepID=UPI001D1B8430|nr:hypothetical protein [Pedobacter sp. Bi27]CAH0288633.1 hypothetical protein SRABI27_03999 [Pedobacter sp. Bi27]